MAKQGCLLVVDDNKSILVSVKMLMEGKFSKVVTLENPMMIPSALRENKPEVVLLDMNFRSGINNGNEGLYWLKEIKKLSPATQVVLFTAYADIELAVNGIKEGAADFVVKPFDNDKLSETLLSVCAGNKRGKQAAVSVKEMYWGESPAMLALRKTVEKVALTDANVLITGENGTGKEMLAGEIHRLSARSGGPMVPVDMGAITETLFESELFGHAKGAFTDAKTDRAGKFEEAAGGTLFLDEIGNLSYSLQAKLLTAVQSRMVTRVGENVPRPVNVRLVCATNRNLDQMLYDGQFREDLLYRINTIHLELPPLRERKEDIGKFADIFIKKYANVYGKPGLALAQGAADQLAAREWPGNIRELEHSIEKAVILCDGNKLNADDIGGGRSDMRKAKASSSGTLEDMERDMIAKALDDCGGNMSMVAARLGITRQTLYNKIKKFGL